MPAGGCGAERGKAAGARTALPAQVCSTLRFARTILYSKIQYRMCCRVLLSSWCALCTTCRGKGMALERKVQYSTGQGSTLQCLAVQYRAVLYNTVACSTGGTRSAAKQLVHPPHSRKYQRFHSMIAAASTAVIHPPRSLGLIPSSQPALHCITPNPEVTACALLRQQFALRPFTAAATASSIGT
jgi:hypothetical protein